MPPRAPLPGEGEALREAAMAAILEASGELGYRRVSVEVVLDRWDGDRAGFYRLFASKERCFEAAYEAHSGRLCESLLAAGAGEPSWARGLAAAIAELRRYMRASPLLARGVLVEAHLAGAAVLGRREEVLERLSRALDRARRETESRHSPPPLAAPLMVGAIDAAAAAELDKVGAGRLDGEALREVAWIAAALYLGEEEAAEVSGRLKADRRAEQTQDPGDGRCRHPGA